MLCAHCHRDRQQINFPQVTKAFSVRKGSEDITTLGGIHLSGAESVAGRCEGLSAWHGSDSSHRLPQFEEVDAGTRLPQSVETPEATQDDTDDVAKVTGGP